MNILLTLHHPLNLNSGASGSTLKLVENYRALGHNVEIYSYDNLPRLPEQVQMLVFPFFVAAHLNRRALRRRLDVIDAHTGDSWVWATFFRRRAAKTALITRSSGLEHSGHLERLEEQQRGQLKLSRLYFWYHGGFRLWEVARSLRLSDGCILLNSQDQGYAVETLGVSAQKTCVSGNGIPDSYLNLPLETEVDAQTKSPTPRIAVIGTYSERKGIVYSVPALQRLLNTYPSLEIGFFGTGVPEARVLSDFSAPTRARIRVVSRYDHHELPQLLRGFEIQLLASISEGFGKVLLEGMSCGLACVTTDAPGPLEIARDGENALVVPRRDSEAIFSALERLIQDQALRQNLRRAGYESAQNHTWQAVAQNRLAFYEAVRQARSK